MARKNRKKTINKNGKRMSPREFRAILDEISKQRGKERGSATATKQRATAGKKTTLVLAKRDKSDTLVFVEIKPGDTNDFYNITNAFPSRSGYTESKKLLWKAAQSLPGRESAPSFKRQEENSKNKLSESKEQVKNKPLYSVKNVKPWPKDFPNVTVHTTLSKLTSHPDYEAAKTGNREAALRLALDLVNIEKAKKLGKDHPNAVLLPVSQMEEAGRNVLPRALAWVISKHSGLIVATDIIETRKVGRTKKSALVKFFELPVFEGKVIQGQDYILIDDAVSQGATLSELRHFIDNAGGNVVNISTLAAAKFSTKIAPRTKTVQKIEEKFGRDNTEKFLREYSVAGTLEALTERQALYLLSFGSLNTLRERATSEGIPRGRRILQEGTRD